MNDLRHILAAMRNPRLRGLARPSRAIVVATASLSSVLVLASGCQRASIDPRPTADISPSHLFMFSPLQAVPAAEGIDALKVDLGRRLYYDTHLSANNSMSCNSCHQLSKYGVDPGQSVSLGFEQKPGGRNSPTVYNAGLQFAQFWDGRAATLVAQASGPMMNPVEMGMSGPDAVLEYIHSNPDYVRQFKQAYPNPKDPVTMDDVTDAIANFEGRLLTPARWDEYLKGNENALSDGEKQGLRVYLRSGCASCHGGTGMGGNSYAKLGAFQDWSDQKSDTGRMGLTHHERDLMYFKVPLLRNVVQTGPWFHDGKVKTIDEAVRLMGQHELGRNLTAAKVSSIVTFLNALTGPIPQKFIQPPSQQTPAGRAGTIAGLSPKMDLHVNTATEKGE
jgi:cytochrome c peroxidase